MHELMDDELPNPYHTCLCLGVLGGIVGAGIELARAVNAFYEMMQPLPPGVARCGNCVLGAQLRIVIGPLLGAFEMAMIGLLLGGALTFWRLRRQERRANQDFR